MILFEFYNYLDYSWLFRCAQHLAETSHLCVTLTRSSTDPGRHCAVLCSLVSGQQKFHHNAGTALITFSYKLQEIEICWQCLRWKIHVALWSQGWWHFELNTSRKDDNLNASQTHSIGLHLSGINFHFMFHAKCCFPIKCAKIIIMKSFYNCSVVSLGVAVMLLYWKRRVTAGLRVLAGALHVTSERLGLCFSLSCR